MDEQRIELLARRVRWLDRYRRRVAVLFALALGPLVFWQMSEFLGRDWPTFHSTLLTLVVCVLAWWVTEVSLAWKTAVWETECDRLVRDKGLPRAEVIVKR